MNKITIIAPLTAPKRRLRLAKMIPLYLANDIKVGFCGWDRIPGEAAQWRWSEGEIEERIILKGGGHNTKLARLMYPLWMARVFLFVLFSSGRQVFHCLGWETAFPAVIAAVFKRHKIVFDDADRFSMILGLRGVIGSIVMALEDWTGRGSIMRIIPSTSRYPKPQTNDFVLPNSPTKSDISKAENVHVERMAEFVIYANGWLPETRGIRFITQAFERFAQGKNDVGLVIAGFIPEHLEADVLKGDKSKFLGEMTQAQSLALYNVVDVLVTFYDPKIEINQRAESNKWADAASFRTPFIVNSEVVTAANFLDAGVAFPVQYGDEVGLAELFERLYSDPNILAGAVESFSTLKNYETSFDDRFQEVINGIFPATN